jgi:hypothetical protein
MLPTKFRFIWPSFRGDFYKKLTNQKQKLPTTTIFITGSGQNEHLYRGPPIDASYNVLVHLDKRFQRRRFLRNRPIRNKNCLWRPCLLTDQDDISNLNRGPSIYASYQVSIHLAKQLQSRRLFRNRPIRNKNCLCLPWL